MLLFWLLDSEFNSFSDYWRLSPWIGGTAIIDLIFSPRWIFPIIDRRVNLALRQEFKYELKFYMESTSGRFKFCLSVFVNIYYKNSFFASEQNIFQMHVPTFYSCYLHNSSPIFCVILRNQLNNVKFSESILFFEIWSSLW